jgi:hypothetical protein
MGDMGDVSDNGTGPDAGGQRAAEEGTVEGEFREV